MTMRGGNIVRKIGGESIKRAKKSLILEATHDNLTLYSAKKVEMIGEQGGVEYLNDYIPPPPLRVVKLDGPFDENGQKVSCIKKGISYQYKIVNFNRQPKPHELIRIKWATQLDEGEIISKYPQNNGKQEAKFLVSKDVKNSKFSVYAYLEKPSKDVSILSRLDDKFYYKGTKQWGKLQKYKTDEELDFSAKFDRITNKDIEANANSQGKKAYKRFVDWGEETGLKMAKFYYESSITGTRKVLSDNVADKVVHNFYYGRGKKLSFKDWPQFQSDLEEYPYFRQYFKNYLEVIKYMLKEKSIQDKDGEELIKIFNDKDFDSRPNFSKIVDILKYDFYGLMGGTQTIKVDLEITEIESNKYKIKTEMYIGDWYGADWDDLNGKGVKEFAPSLKAFFMLQHYYGCQPFETEIFYKSIDYIGL